MKFLSASPVTAYLLASLFSTPIFSLPPQPTSSVTPILLQSRHDYPLYTPAVQRRFKMQPDGSMKEVTGEGIQMLSSTWTVRCYNSGLWMPIAKITPHINTFCSNENGRKVHFHYQRLFVENFGATNGGTANLRIGYENEYGDQLNGWTILNAECMEWLYAIVFSCTPNSNYDTQGGLFYTSSGNVYFDPNDNYPSWWPRK